MDQKKGSPPDFRKKPPEGVVEVIDQVGRGWSIVERRDGTLFAVSGRHWRSSSDDGCSWSDPEELSDGIDGAVGLIRLGSGTLMLSLMDENRRYSNRLSRDEGQSWEASHAVPMLGTPYYDTLIQISDGRLVYPNRVCHSNSNHPELLRDDVVTFGIWRGYRRLVSGHYHYPEIDIASISFSDDEGTTWHMCDGTLMGWFDGNGVANGLGGVTACDEPSVAEAADGRLVFFGRSTVGRIVASYSSDRGETWSAVRPTELAASYSPPRLARIPSTGDLLCVWNQVSRDEIRRGYRRNRLSAAVSRDAGMSWENFKTIEVSAGLDDVDRITPEYPTTPVIGLRNVGVLPEDFAIFRYPNVCCAKGKVYLLYAREWFELEEETSGAFEDKDSGRVRLGREQVLRIYPLEYFYA